MSRRSSANVLGGIGSPSGVRKSSRRPAAFFSLGLKPRIPNRINAAFIRLTIRVCSPTRLWRSRLGRCDRCEVCENIAPLDLKAHFGLWLFAPPFGPPDLVGRAGGLHDSPLIGGTERTRKTGQRSLDEPGFEDDPYGLAKGIEFPGHPQ